MLIFRTAFYIYRIRFLYFSYKTYLYASKTFFSFVFAKIWGFSEYIRLCPKFGGIIFSDRIPFYRLLSAFLEQLRDLLTFAKYFIGFFEAK